MTDMDLYLFMSFYSTWLDTRSDSDNFETPFISDELKIIVCGFEVRSPTSLMM